MEPTCECLLKNNYVKLAYTRDVMIMILIIMGLILKIMIELRMKEYVWKERSIEGSMILTWFNNYNFIHI